MHRTFSVPRLIGRWSLALALLLQVGISAVIAQPSLPGQNRPVIELAVGTARTCKMTTQADLKRVENPNSNVVRVERVADKNNEILLVAENPGRTAITFTDQKDRVEVHEIIVASSTLPAQPMPDELRSVLLTKGSFKSIKLREIPTAIDNPNSKVLKIIRSPDSPDVVLFEGVDYGRVLVTITGAKGKEIFEVLVAPDDTSAKGVHAVELHVVVAVVNRTESRQMSFSWAINGPNWFIGSLIGGGGSFANLLTPAFSGASSTMTGTPNIPFGVLNNNGSFNSFLQALRTEGLAKVLAEPRVTTLSGRPGRILSGGETPVILPGTAGSVPSVDYKAFGTVVNFLPIVKANGKIYLEVRPEISQIDPSAGVNVTGTFVNGFRTRSAQVAVEMEDGQTLAIGGLIQNTVSASISRVPFLGDLPFLGAAFTSKSYKEDEEEVIILVTPRLVHPVDCTKIPRYLPGRETRTPDDFEFFLEGIMEAPRGQRNVVLHPNMYRPAYHNASNIGQIPCGDGSNCYNGRGAGCSSGHCGTNHGLQTTSGNYSTPTPSFPDMNTLPTSGSRIMMESDLPGQFPPIRETLPSVAPSGPPMPMMPSRSQEPRPVLPPLSIPR